MTLQKRLRRELIRAHAESLQQNREAVCDHSVFVWLADWMRWLWSETPAAGWEEVLAEARQAVERSLVDPPRVRRPRRLDGYRWLDPGHARQLERLTRCLYRELGCEARVKEVPCEHRAQRRPQAGSALFPSRTPHAGAGPATYNQDGLATRHNADFMRDPRFLEAYRAGLENAPAGTQLEWRVHVALWCATQALRLEGDFVECGVHTGILSAP